MTELFEHYPEADSPESPVVDHWDTYPPNEPPVVDVCAYCVHTRGTMHAPGCPNDHGQEPHEVPMQQISVPVIDLPALPTDKKTSLHYTTKAEVFKVLAISESGATLTSRLYGTGPQHESIVTLPLPIELRRMLCPGDWVRLKIEIEAEL